MIKFKNSENIEYRIVLRKIQPKDSNGLRAKEIDGYCEPPSKKNPKIVIDKSLDKKRLTEVLIHEIYHAFNFDQTEEKTTSFAKKLTKILIYLNLLKN